MSVRLDTRTFAALAFADEVCERPSLLAMFAEQFGPDADATLVLAADRAASDVSERVLGAGAAVGLPPEALPDLLLLPLAQVDEELVGSLAAAVDALVSERVPAGPLTQLPQFGVTAGDVLRDHAEATIATAATVAEVPFRLRAVAAAPAGPPTAAPDVTALARQLGADFDCAHVLAVGPDALATVEPLAAERRLIGIGSAEDLAGIRNRLPQHTWIEWNAARDPFPRLPQSVVRRSIAVCGGLLERTPEFARLLLPLTEVARLSPVLLLTRDAEGCSLEDLERMLTHVGLAPTFSGITRTARGGEKDALLAIVEREADRVVQRAPAPFKVTAVMSAYNEEDVIERSIEKLVADGVHVRLIDNWSTDATLERAAALDFGELLTIERFPAAGPSGTFDLTRLLQNVERIAATIVDGWVIHMDVDEVRRSPWPGVSLRDALYHVQERGFNAVNHVVMRFHPTDDSFTAGDDPERRLRSFELEPGYHNQIKAWDARVGPVDLATSGGHSASFAGRRIFPWRFALQHYPIRSQAHGELKLFRDRKARWNPEERARGWHSHYDRFDPGHAFLRRPQDLLHHDAAFAREYLLERVAGVGIGHGLPAPR